MDEKLLERMGNTASEYKESEEKLKTSSEKAAMSARRIKEEGPVNLWERIFHEVYSAHKELKKTGVPMNFSVSHIEHPHVSFEYEEKFGYGGVFDVIRIFYKGQETGYCIMPERPFLLVFDAALRYPQDDHDREMAEAMKAIVLEWDDVFASAINNVIAKMEERINENYVQIEKAKQQIRSFESFLDAHEKDGEER